jgi:hypothetical protein
MARIRESGPPGNQNAFRHRSGGDFTAGVNGPLTPDEHAIREEILAGLVSDKGGAAQISTAMPVLAEVIARDVTWLVAFNRAIDGCMECSQKARSNPKALHTLHGYKRGLVNSLTEIFSGLDSRKPDKAESLQDIIKEMSEADREGSAP